MASLLFAGCGPDIKLAGPLSSREHLDAKVEQPIALHVSAAARLYEATGWIWVVPYRVEFGDSLEANAVDAFAQSFAKAEAVDHFPPTGPKAPRLALDVEIAGSDVSPGWLTILSSSASVDLRGRLSIDGVVLPGPPIAVRGEATDSPGPLGAMPGANSGAYDQALQSACEDAMGDALDKLVDATIARIASTAP